MSFSDGGSFNNRVRTSPASQRGGRMDLSVLMKVEDEGMVTLTRRPCPPAVYMTNAPVFRRGCLGSLSYNLWL
jgi:hypothetical protein